jgi:prophage regulatory protein
MHPGRQPPRFLPYDQLKHLVPFTRQHLKRLEDAGTFPRRVQIGANRVAWREDEIVSWADERSAERTPPVTDGTSMLDLTVPSQS